MSSTFTCKLITPEARVFEEEVSYVSLPLHDGLAGFQAKRAPIVAELGLGELKVTFTSGKTRHFALDAGFAQMADNHLTILAEEATEDVMINATDAKAELAEANARTGATGDELTQIVHDRNKATLKVKLAAASN
ncbi:MAG: FoF1 ATP synthase subunit delta/epsilon [Planctomycetota bacterium]|jgi:F-type H+-transporting ATPase subunit epsilon